MQKAAVLYWSASGSTEAMAAAVAEGLRAGGADVTLSFVSDFHGDIDAFDRLALGCPAAGAEELEAEVFEPFYRRICPRLAGKKLALFGSYGWGDGEWMRTWEQDADGAGAVLFGEGLILLGQPDSEGLERCRDFGRDFAAF